MALRTGGAPGERSERSCRWALEQHALGIAALLRPLWVPALPAVAGCDRDREATRSVALRAKPRGAHPTRLLLGLARVVFPVVGIRGGPRGASAQRREPAAVSVLRPELQSRLGADTRPADVDARRRGQLLRGASAARHRGPGARPSAPDLAAARADGVRADLELGGRRDRGLPASDQGAASDAALLCCRHACRDPGSASPDRR